MRSFLVALLGFLAGSTSASADQLIISPDRHILVGDFAGAAAAFEADGGLASLARACMLRRGLGHAAQAATDIDRFFTTLSDTKTAATAESAAELFLNEIIGELTWPDEAAWESALRRLVAALRLQTSSVVRLRAQLRLADYLWHRSCPMAGTDGACIERLDAAEECLARRRAVIEANKAKKQHLNHCLADPPLYRYVVHHRLLHLANEAQEIVRTVLRSALLRRPPSSFGSQLADVQAQALFLQAEPQFETALAQRLPVWAVETHDPKDRRYDSATPLFRSFLSQRLRKSEDHGVFAVREQPVYERIIKSSSYPGADTRWSIAAAARIAHLALHVQHQVGECMLPSPIPLSQSGSNQTGIQTFTGGYCHPEDSLWEGTLDSIVSRCHVKEVLQQADDPYLHFCLELSDKLKPVENPPAREFYTPAGVAGPLMLTSAPIS